MGLALLAAAAAEPADPWKPLRFLVGDWVAEGGGVPGRGAGSLSFQLDLEGKVLVRRNRADYPASAGRAAFHHEDLMVIYPESEGKAIRAIYFDNEGHVIRYEAEFVGEAVRFLSEASASGPRYRLTYRKTGSDTVTVDFEIAPPGKPEAFAHYAGGAARRK
ncbi:MAG: hypothetical protein HY238_27010 [Acidobacteria bacterium]|nr:hypothetical protein [Acidobacteriota bacterium]